MAAVSQLAAAHATETSWTVGATLAPLITAMISSAVRSASPLMPDLPHTDAPVPAAPTGDTSREATAVNHSVLAGHPGQPARLRRRPVPDATRRSTPYSRVLET
ncbi:hypothetical protein AB0F52_48500 [Amycolatopsis sp. NPDC024027]|uniref:hypothetical protein n=1 Tax=Amycolatopsis sp. NPDC024027 TaxID=3154327 RepID=UPI0033FD59C6